MSVVLSIFSLELILLHSQSGDADDGSGKTLGG